jgi:AAA15 family ATPase/GTPase
MLVSFSVQNYRSFADRQSISMVAGTSASRNERVSFPSENTLAPSLLRSSCLFGPNAAGKSSLVKALKFYEHFVVSSAKESQEGESIDVSPFKLDKKWIVQPSEFEATFIHNDILYQYGFAVDSERVWGEWMFSNPNAPGKNKRTLFQREFDPKTNTYEWYINPTHVKGEKELWKKSTRDNALFLSTSVSLKSETFKAPFDWIQKQLRVIESPEALSDIYTASKCESDEDSEKRILELLQSVDLRIKDIGIDFGEFDPKTLPKNMPPEVRESIKKELDGKRVLNRVLSFHESVQGELVPFEMDEESDGTQVVFNLAWPWLDVLENGYTLIVDELHNSLHPHALKVLVNLFHDPKINANKAQLIFTSHETSVMTKGFMHQDQVWLIEKDDEEKSRLFPLSDYKVRDVAGFQKAYLNGRFGAVPKLKEFVDG